MKEFSLANQEYLHPPRWSRRFTLGKLIISMSVKNNITPENMIGPHVHNRLANLRRERGITRRSLARDLHISEATLVALEEARYIPSLELALRISEWFGVPVETIFSYI